jgi:hypothetical protein
MQFRVKLIINGHWAGVPLLFPSSGRFVNCWIYVKGEKKRNVSLYLKPKRKGLTGR